MSNKPFDKLNVLDATLRRLFPTGMRDAIDVTITKRTGFELQNTRPYHNYETWSDEWRIEGEGCMAVKEDLDDALAEFCRMVITKREKEAVRP